MPQKKDDLHFVMIFWFIVGLTLFGAFFTIYLLIRFKGDIAVRFADQMIMFWLSTAVSGGIGYLIGNSVGKQTTSTSIPISTGATTEISATIKSDNKDEIKP